MMESVILRHVESGEQIACAFIRGRDQLYQVGMRVIDAAFAHFVERDIADSFLRVPACYVGVDRFPEPQHFRSDFACEKHSLPTADFVERHIVKRLQGRIQGGAEAAIPIVAKFADGVCCARPTQDAYFASQAHDDGSAPFGGAGLVEPIKFQSAFSRPAGLVRANKVRRRNRHNRSDRLHPTSEACAVRGQQHEARAAGQNRRQSVASEKQHDSGGENSNYGEGIARELFHLSMVGNEVRRSYRRRRGGV